MKTLTTHASTYITKAESYKTATLNGKPYIVAPVVAIVAGVLNGELVTADEIGNGFGSWNGRPVTLDHPMKGGIHVSANDPGIWEEYVVGQLFNTQFVDRRLKGEIWIDVELANKSTDGKDLLSMLSQSKPIEVSTAYFRQLLEDSGTYNGKEYQAKALDLKPDHLAILLHATGACSWGDGCGVPRINEREVTSMPYENEHAARLQDPGQYDEFRRDNDKFGDGIDAIWGLTSNGETKAELQSIRFDSGKFTPEEAKAWLAEHDYDPSEFEPAVNEEAETQTNENLSWWKQFKDNVRNALFGNQDESLEEQWDAVVSAFYNLIETGQPIGEIGDGYVVKVYPEHIIVERTDGRLFQVDYTTGEAGVEFGDQVEVKMVYQPVTSNEDDVAGSQSESEMEESTDEELAENEGAEPEASEIVEEVDEELENTEIEPATNDEEPEEIAPPAANDSKCEKYVALVEFADEKGGPEWALATLKEVVTERETKRTNLIQSLAANESCAFSLEELESFGDAVLIKLQASLEAPRANYSGLPSPAKPEPPKGRRKIELPPLSG